MMSARTSHANPSNSIMSNAVPNVVAAILKNRECWTRFLSLHGESTCLGPPCGGWILKSLTLSVGCGAWWRQLHLPLRSHHPKRPLATRIGYVHLQFFPTPLKRHRLTPEP